MRVPAVLCLVILAIIILVCAEVAQGKKPKKEKDKKRKKGGGGGGNKATGETGNCNVRAVDLDRLGGLQCGSNKSVITDLSFMGRNGTCEGLTPQLFVQTANCMWKTRCDLTYKRDATNYMIKLHAGPPSCIVLAPEHFHFNFSCNKSIITDVITENDDTRTLRSGSGLLKSHAQHPWHYNRPEGTKNYNVTLQNPSGAGSRLCFTFRKYHLSHGDYLAIGPWHSYNKNDTLGRTHCLNETREVVVTLTLSHLSHGAEGFLLCYSWENKDTTNDLCTNLLSPVSEAEGDE